MLVLLTGYPRSGTELLTRLCNTHPDVSITLELGAFRTFWVSPGFYSLGLWRSLLSRPFPVLPDREGRWRGWRAWLESYRFLFHFTRYLSAERFQDVEPARVEQAYRQTLGCRVVGDKLPAYSLSLDQFAAVEGLRCVVMYRHPFSVVRSYLELVQGSWSEIPTLNKFNTPEVVAGQWARSVRVLRRHWDRVLPISYERLCEHPAPEVVRLAKWLEVEPDGFDLSVVKAPRQGPTYHPRVVEQIVRAAGPELEFLGYHV